MKLFLSLVGIRRISMAIPVSMLLTPTLLFSQLSMEPDVSKPCVVSGTDGKLHVFALGGKRELLQRTWNQNTWGSWQDLGGRWTASPSATSSLPGRIDVILRDSEGQLMYMFHQNGGWSSPAKIGVVASSAPAAVSILPSMIDLFFRSQNGHLLYWRYLNGRWREVSNFGQTLAYEPVAVVPRWERAEIVIVTSRGTLLHRSWNGQRWSGWTEIPEEPTAAPALAAGPDRSLHLFIRSRSGIMGYRSRVGNAWGRTTAINKKITAAPVAVFHQDKLQVFVRDVNDQLSRSQKSAQAWDPWYNLGGPLNGKLHARVRLLTHNIYGLHEKFHTFRQNYCPYRSQSFGRKVAKADPAYDIVGLQEFYGTPSGGIRSCSPEYLDEAIQSTGRYKNSNNQFNHRPKANNRPNGGVGVFTLHQIGMHITKAWHNDVQDWPSAPEGFIFVRIKLNNAPVELDCYIVHLNSGGENRERRKMQLWELAIKMGELSKNSGNPVIVMGDFNIGGPPSNKGNDAYVDIKNALRGPEDLWMRTHPTEDGFTDDCPGNTINKNNGCSGSQRIDYIFVVTDKQLTNSPYLVKVDNPQDVKIIRWRADDISQISNIPITSKTRRTHVSDHFGLEATIEIRDK